MGELDDLERPVETIDGPPMKISRLEAESSIEPVASSSISIHPIIDEKLRSESVPLHPFSVVRLADKRKIGVILKLLPEIPAEFEHLKRVDKSGRVLVQPEEIPISEELRAKLGSAGIGDECIEVASVPALKPITRKQFEWAKSYWSTSFHPNKELEDSLSEVCFSPDQLEYIESWAKKAEATGCLVVQRSCELASGCLGSSLLSHPVMKMVEELSEVNREVSQEYLATGCDVFLRHEPCAMCAMALVHARAERVFFVHQTVNGVLLSGSWQLHLEPKFNHHYKVFHVFLDKSSTEKSVCGK